MSARKQPRTARLLIASIMYLATTMAVLFLGWLPAALVGFAGFGATALVASSGARSATPLFGSRRARG